MLQNLHLNLARCYFASGDAKAAQASLAGIRDASSTFLGHEATADFEKALATFKPQEVH